jgi:hypothetical protein
MSLEAQTFFAYSDEFGSYHQKMSEKHLRVHPYYIRSVILLPCDEWKSLDSNLRRLKRKHRIPFDVEVKWAHLWSLRSYQKDGKEIPAKHPCYFLQDIDYHVLIAYVEEVLAYYSSLQASRVIFTITDNKTIGNYTAARLYEMHLMNIAQRLQYELRSSGSLAVLFFDSVGQSVDKLLKDAWHSISSGSDYVKEYTCVKRSAYIEYSHQSPGMQVSDYVAGAIGSYIKAHASGRQESYARGIAMFENYVNPCLRRNPEDQAIIGWGALNVPTQIPFKAWLTTCLQSESC